MCLERFQHNYKKLTWVVEEVEESEDSGKIWCNDGDDNRAGSCVILTSIASVSFSSHWPSTLRTPQKSKHSYTSISVDLKTVSCN
jgi:hypothetical protein